MSKVKCTALIKSAPIFIQWALQGTESYQWSTLLFYKFQQ